MPGLPHECFADEVAIDFPSVGRCVELLVGDAAGPAEQCGRRRMLPGLRAQEIGQIHGRILQRSRPQPSLKLIDWWVPSQLPGWR